MQRNNNQIAIYSRKSRFTGKGESIGNQIDLCKDYVRNIFGPDCVDKCVIFEDEGFSGGDLKRPDFQKMMEEVRQHKFSTIIVYRLDRISRNISDFAGLIGELTKLEVSFVSIREQFDTTTPMGRAMMYIVSVFSQLERETIAERIRDNMHELAKTGRWLGGNTPTGYGSESISNVTMEGKVRKACKLKLIPREAEIVKTIFDLYIQMDSLTSVEAELMRRRIRTKKGNDFTRFSIKAILQNPVYMIASEEAYQYFEEKGACLCSERAEFDGGKGMMVYNRTDQKKGRAATYLPMTEWIVAVGKHPGLISSRQWIAIQQSLERNKSKAYRKPRSNEALLTGLLFCACGERMYPKLTKRQNGDGVLVYTYVCRMKERSKRERCNRKNVSGNLLDLVIVEQVKQLTEDDNSFVAQMEKSKRCYSGEREGYKSRMAALRAEFAGNEKNINGLIDSLSIAGDSSAKFRVLKRIEDLSEVNQGIEKQILELEGLTSAQALSVDEFDGMRKLLATFRGSVDGMLVEEKRAAIRTVVRKVVWDGHNAHVVLFGADEEEMERPEILERGSNHVCETGSDENAVMFNPAETRLCEDSK